MFGGGGRFAGPHWRFAVDFTALPDGGLSAAAFTAATLAQKTNKGLTHACSTGVTVQTGPTTVVTGLPADTACVGSRDGVKRGLVIEPLRVNGVVASAVNYARNIRTGTFASPVTPRFFADDLGHDSDDHNQSQQGTVTVDAAAGPDGNVLADRLQVTGGPRYSGGGAHLGQDGTWERVSAFNNVEVTLSCWIKAAAASTNRLTWLERIPWDQGSGPGQSATHVVETIFSATGGWERHYVARPPGVTPNVSVYAINEGTDRSQDEGSTIGALTSDAMLDLIQVEPGKYPHEVILTADGLSGGRRVAYAHGNDWGDAGRLRMYVGFIPKHASTEVVGSTQDISQLGTVAAFTLWSWTSGTRVYCEIVQGGADSYKVKLVDHEVTMALSVEALSWAANDFVELFIESGAGAATKIKWRLNDPGDNSVPWTVMTDVTALVTVVPTGTVNMFWSGIDETRTGAFRAAFAATADRFGGP